VLCEDSIRGITRPALDQAKASLALAESRKRRSAGVDVPGHGETWPVGNRTRMPQLLGAQGCGQGAGDIRAGTNGGSSLCAANVEKKPCERRAGQGGPGTYLPLMRRGEISKQQYDAAKANADATPSALQADLQKQAQAQRTWRWPRRSWMRRGRRGASASGSGVRAGRRQAGEHEDRGCQQNSQGGAGASQLDAAPN